MSIVRVPLLLGVILIVAFTARALRCEEGLPYLHTWDEPQTASAALDIIKTGDLNPHFFNYGSLMIYLNVAVDAAHYLYLMTQGESSPNHINGVWDLETERNTGYHWSVSHPSFLYWNRLLTALMGTASVLLVYLLASELKGPWGGLAAAGCLAGIEFHVEHSALVTPNVPATFFTLIATLLSVRFLTRGRLASLLGAAAACGLAASTKYNFAISIVAPLLALGLVQWREGSGSRSGLWIAVVLVAMMAFLAGTPYALLDLPHFLGGVGYEIRHYAVRGFPGTSIQPGLPHLIEQLRTIGGNLGILPVLLVAVGLIAVAAAQAGWVIFCFPLAYLLFMSSAKVAEHRNDVGIYPFASVAFGCGCMAAFALIEKARLRASGKLLARTAIVLLTATSCLVAAGGTLASSWRLARTPDTRAQVIDWLNELAGKSAETSHRVGLAAELNFHQLDMERLRMPHEEAPAFDLLCSGAGENDLIVTADRYLEDRPDERLAVAIMNGMILDEAPAGLLSIGERPCHLDYLNYDLKVLVLQRPRGAACGQQLGLRKLGDKTVPKVLSDGYDIDLTGDAPLATDWSPVMPGPSALVWYASGEAVHGDAARIMCAPRFKLGGIVAERPGQEFTLSRTPTPYAMKSGAPKGASVALMCEKTGGQDISIWSARAVHLQH